MSIYEIDQSIAALVDAETGEILDFGAFEQLQIEREAKIENMALWHKNLLSEAAAIRAEELALAERRKAAETKAGRLKEYLQELLCGEPFKTPKVACSFRKSSAVELSENFLDTADWEYLRFKDPEPNKTAISDALKEGKTVPGAALVERQSLTIK